ncbi:bleomycin hydrolase [Tieghemiomyces parasiticus]|uniref:Cysteine proteinase 1, mitochondrial n=1 Tax=Tieghemiomyces parasiticus TaxID=78921 RepID=A0A9W8AGG6_9FUNG|nr:bleomycin hydrolase [Tieghemiomyces parasiticus]
MGTHQAKVTSEPIVADPAAITINDVDDFQNLFESDPRNRLASNVLVEAALVPTLENRKAVLDLPHIFSEKLELEGKITNQKSSGRCWIFAGLNALRIPMLSEYKIDDLELSQPFVFFYDKLEKCNWFLESIIDLRDKEVDDRTVSFLLTDPAADGGQWDMFVALVEKYGVVPKKYYPESFHTSNTRQMNGLIQKKLRDYAYQIRQWHADNVSVEDIRLKKSKMLEQIYKILAITMGEPPKTVDWTYRDKEGKYHAHEGLSPLEFYHDHVKVHLPDYVSVVNDPRNEYRQTYTVDFLGNVKGGRQVRHLNLEIDELKKFTAEAIKQGKPVWFGCDVGQFLARRSGVLDMEALDYQSAFGVEFVLSKAQRLEYRESLMTHAMMISGVHLDSNGKPTRWRIENSWGEDHGEKGFLCMSDRWFEEYLYQIVVNKNDLPEDVRELLTLEPTVLKAWDPMGSLAV